jgi:predicted phosphodiesterase
MRIHVGSDIHANWTRGKADVPAPDCDLRLWVGDATDGLCNALRIMAETFKDSTAPLAYVPGNHDFFISESEPNAYYQEQLERARILAPKLGVNLLHNDTMIVGGTLRVIGSPLWPDFVAGDITMSKKMKMLQSQRGYLDERPGVKDYHEDFRRIRFGGSGSKNRFTPSQSLALHAEAMAFLKAEIVDKDWDGETLCATHVPPSQLSLLPGGPRMHDWMYCATDCGDLFEHVDVWASGHVHHSTEYEIDGCRLIGNPRGYPNRDGTFENPKWDPNLVIDVERKYAPKIGGI